MSEHITPELFAAQRDELCQQIVPTEHLAPELHFLRQHTPESVHHRRELIVAANGLYKVKQLYGDGRIAKKYAGPAEPVPVPATLHNLRHTALGVAKYAEHANRANAADAEHGLQPRYTDEDILAGVVAYSNHDVVLGNGRQAQNPEAFDELLSANNVAKHIAQVLGHEDSPIAEACRAGILATTYNETTRAQDVNKTRSHLRLQQDITAADLFVFGTNHAIRTGFSHLVEQACKASDGNWLSHVAADQGVDIKHTRDGLRVIDNAGREERERFVASLVGNAAFCEAYQYPAHWTLDDRNQRRANVTAMQQMADQISSGALSASQAYDVVV